ncbi:Protein of uncharacterised function (DUF448) [Arcanobacterium haemolyticum]|uniref:YlxR domain-containing protein n=2 Tax=Arcanobacterium haemolyticum TaxID=28264 RepID=D7BN50_ARCHD|nr:protein of unknown function DUF448 [Arcanobacterium haemolyticum DSM 20595]SPT75932.1 Protein of uncharacterised function (DUF448) [Arcanobacterium haemolyticum]SQH28926.1 Protein of uncharacterised function (DUF448) [Arcanobacterium haemolyticum]
MHVSEADRLDRIMIRTCVGCKGKAHRNELVRVVVSEDGSVKPDPYASAHGRGAWVHPKPECVSRAIKSSQFARAFRRPVASVDAVEEYVSDFVRSVRSTC